MDKNFQNNLLILIVFILILFSLIFINNFITNKMIEKQKRNGLICDNLSSYDNGYRCCRYCHYNNLSYNKEIENPYGRFSFDYDCFCLKNNESIQVY